MGVMMVFSLKYLACAKVVAFTFVLALFSGCSKDQNKISKILAFTAPLGCVIGSMVGKNLAKNKVQGMVAGAVIGGTVATVASVVTGGILYAAASTVFTAITTSIFKHKKNKKDVRDIKPSNTTVAV
jgi:hypothetical protein